MQASRLALSFGLLLTLGSSLALAAPGYEQSHQPPPRHAAPPPQPAVMPGWQQAAPEHKPQHQAPYTSRHPAMQSGPPPRQQAHQTPVRHVRPAHQAPRPPADFRPVRVQIHANRHRIGYGPALPPHVHIVRGKPLPPGWGRRLNAHQHRYVPHYQGYEWRRAGGDLYWWR